MTHPDHHDHERLRAILEYAIDAIITIDEHGIIESANPATETLFGYPVRELAGQNIKVLMPPTEQSEHDQYLHNYLTTGIAKIIGSGREVTARRQDGSTFPVHLAVSEFVIDGKRHFTGMVRDISRLTERQARLQAIMDTAVDAIVTIDRSGIIDSVNPATEKMFGYSADELVGQNVKMLMPDPWRGEHHQYIENYLETGVPKIIGIGREVTALRKDGSGFPIHLAVSEFHVADQLFFTGMIRDISEQKRIEHQEMTLGRIIEDSLNEVYLFDADSLRFLRVNRGARLNLGYSMNELRDLTPMDIKPDFTRESFEALVRSLINGEQDRLQFNTRHRRKDGSNYDVEVHLHASSYQNRPALVAIILDITERLKAEEQLHQQQQEMQSQLEQLVHTRTEELRRAQNDLIRSEKLATLGQVSGGIAHEIRNPLNAVKTSAYFLLNANQPAPDKIREHLERIDRQVSTIDSVITALADVARLPQPDLQPVAMGPVINEIVTSMSLPDSIVVELLIPDDLPRVMVDGNQIPIALRNLIRNARDAMTEGGTLTIDGQVSGDQVVISVNDTGPGIPEKDLERIMEPLVSTKARGMGLGLAITRAIVEKNGGSMQVQSKTGTGSTFSVHLTRQPEAR
ncbi:MAG: PAS domain-containing sensor histidine kinase [Pirellulaceae bacterium]